MPRGRRCALGCESWPPDDDYETCPACGEPTTIYRNLNPLPEDEARTLRLTLEFEEYYQRRASREGVEPELL